MAGYIGSKASVVSSGVERKKTYSITGSTTSLTGLNYTVGKVHVYQNGVRLLDGTDYTATNGTSITLTVAAQSGDNVVVVSQASFQLSESYTSTEADAEFVTKTGDSMTGNLNVTGTVTSDGLTVDGVVSAASISSTASDYSLLLDATSVAANYGHSIGFDTAGGVASAIITRDEGSANKTGLAFATGDASGVSERLRVSYNGDISFYEDTGTTAKFFWDASTERLGIGVSDPDCGLEVQASASGLNSVNLSNTSSTGYGAKFVGGGNTSTRYIADFRDYSGASKLKLDGSGNVGIGTSSPTRQLDVSKAGTAYIRASDTANSVNMDMFAASSGGWIGTQTNHSLNLQTNNTERMRITSSGRVGIGTTSPSSPKFSSSASGVLELRGSKPSFNVQESDYTDAHFNMSMSAGNAYLAATGTGNLILATGTANWSERMRIDASGRVTKPNQPAFHYRLASGSAITLGNGIISQTFSVSLGATSGNGYNATTGVFTAPVAGWYAFNVTFYYAGGGSYVGTKLQQSNGDSYYSFDVPGADVNTPLSKIIYLSAGDTVRPQTYVYQSTTLHVSHSYFSGYLLG